MSNIVNVNGVIFGNNSCPIIAGPCSVENEKQIITIAEKVKELGASMLRGGAYKPRTNPFHFQGLGKEGLELLKIARKETGLPIVSECVSVNDLYLFEDIDMIQIGSRNMQNFDLLKEVGKFGKPVLLKRGFCATIYELLCSAAYIQNQGNNQIVLCERGIRTFNEEFTRNTLDLSIVPIVHQNSDFPIIVDPSHGTGNRSLIIPMSLAAAACGADGLMIEVHQKPDESWTDSKQTIDFNQFNDLVNKLKQVRK